MENSDQLQQKVSLQSIRDTFYKCRDFEISNLWQRAIFLSAFLVLCFTMYGYLVSVLLKDTSDLSKIVMISEIACGISLLGLAFSMIWIMMAKGSKAWYEVYERHICEIEAEEDLGIPEEYRMGAPCKPWGLDSNLFTKRAGKYSVSKLNIMIGMVLLLSWFVIFVIHYVSAIVCYAKMNIDCCLHVLILVFLPIIFLIILITSLCNVWARSNSLKG